MSEKQTLQVTSKRIKGFQVENEKLLEQVEKLCPVDDSLTNPVEVELNVA